MAQFAGMLETNMGAVFFIYGLALFTMGLAVALESRRYAVPAMAGTMLFLAAFGLLQSLMVWAGMFLAFAGGVSEETAQAAQSVRIGLLLLSTLALIEFATRQLAAVDSRLGPLRWSAPVAVAVWSAMTIPIVLSGPWPAGQRLLAMEAWTRYILYFPASVLTAWCLYRLGRYASAAPSGQFLHGARAAAVAFAANAVVAGLMAPASVFPGISFLSYGSVAGVTGIPVPVFGTVSALALAVLVVRMLRIFESDHVKTMKKMSEERFAAQQAALQARREAQQQLELEVAKRTEELRALQNIGTEISALLDLDLILESVVTKARQLLGTDFSALSLLDEESGEVRVRATSAEVPAAGPAGGDGGKIPAGKIAQLGEPYYSTENQGAAGILHNPSVDRVLNEVGLYSRLEATLMIKGRSIGLLHVAQRAPRAFSEGDLELLRGLANQAAIAIDNARLYEQVQGLAIMEERERIAREMHDGLAQVFSFLNLKLINLRHLLDQRQMERSVTELDKMERALEEATADIRESILSLRSNISAKDGLVPALKGYLRKYEEQTGIAVELFVGGSEVIRLAPPVEVQLLRIVQEALTNVRKHAAASRAWVTFEVGTDDIRVSVEDNGRGIDLADGKKAAKGYGLDTMRERSQTVGGSMSIDSVLERGTKVDIRVPRKFAEER